MHPLISREDTLAHSLPIAPSWPGGVTAAPSALLGKNLQEAALIVVEQNSYQRRLGNSQVSHGEPTFAFRFLN